MINNVPTYFFRGCSRILNSLRTVTFYLYQRQTSVESRVILVYCLQPRRSDLTHQYTSVANRSALSHTSPRASMEPTQGEVPEDYHNNSVKSVDLS